ncbi:protein FAR-RED-ELONGATED HYPOCOTYL 1-LIKE-like isoform X2 [Gastrolobium bilobum]|nr:protein FAR-RED-ELONGATED HYPOCOTYL 1-LIKE-like isoform X2 [Gastrolobium bilobum]XP_061353339.1 protein FAR-RED-ELONGATED HYPOCOTYL 1-LIKE-like isoform X2 [Gastrolobium bilobum]XP_061353340.1 protein FAR-RED-ELONGATED HYPOCOTYL 1-LIKE-like isoform X2 [Gastrolobium bilobum]
MNNINIVEWNKKRKLLSDQLDLLRPKHKCWVGSFSSEHASMFEDNLALESMHNHMVESRTEAAFLDDRSKPESAKDSNSFIEDSDTAKSINEETKLEADCANANTYLYVNMTNYSEEEAFVESEYNPSYHDPDIQALKNSEEHLLGLGSFSGHVYSEYVKEGSEHPVDMEFEDFPFSNGVNQNMYVLSSGRRNVNQEAQSSTRPPTIDQEFEQYFSMLML